jgi:hypothetical protein
MGTELWPPPWLLVPFPIPLCVLGETEREKASNLCGAVSKRKE